ncbi:MAG TPA: 2-phospho-L-lactate transferase [Acidimicrobiales bacterium]|jgi:LPPG:FO 2-phospho-L-lactate transferase|nr:2-phospho-L-lactate transferase [Acidimicrobiales bacterium]
MLVALAGGVGAARLLRGLIDVVDPSEVVAVVNTGDDIVLHGLHISPDLDTVTYTLAGAINPETGWGLAGESWQAMAALGAYGDGSAAWFRLGDRDLGTHLYRTNRLAGGVPLSRVSAEIAARWGVAISVLPMSDDPVETRVTVAGTEIGFQEYFVGRRHQVAVEGVRFRGVEAARPAPGVLAAIAAAERVVICPSNPIVSIGPVLAVPGLAAAVAARRADTVAVSPIVGGRALKGPADRMLGELGHDVSVVGVARIYAAVASTLVIDHADADLAPAVEAEGMTCIVTATVMTGPAEAAALARTVAGVTGP